MARLFHMLEFIRSLKAPQVNSKFQFRNYKSVLGDKVTELTEKTLTGRLLIYLNNFNPNVILNENKLNLKQVTIDLKYYDIEHIKASIKNLDIGQNLSDLNLLQDLDRECISRVKQMETYDIFEILHIFMQKIPNRITKYKFYDNSMKELSNRLKLFNKNEIIQYIFFIGLRKKSSRNHEVVRKCLNQLIESGIDSLTAEDLCVICNSTFKTTTRINNEEFLSKINTYLDNNLHIFKDPALFITILKSIRQNRYQDKNLLTTMTYTIFFNKTLVCYSFAAICHILAVYSDYLYYDENILRVFSERCIRLLQDVPFKSMDEHMSTQPRLKDIKRLLWCLSNLNYNGLKDVDIKNVLIPNILQRVEAGDVEDNYSSLIEITLYLWMLNYRVYEFVPYFLNKNIIETVINLNTPIKQRTNLLLTCMFYEEKQLLKGLGYYPKPNVDYDMANQLKKRPLLQKIISNLKEISKKHELNRFEISCQIPGINIIGVTGYRKNIHKTVHVELLDEYTTLKNTNNLPSGPMQLKIRLLDQLEEAVILVDSDEIGSMDDDEIQQVLLEEIDFVC